MSATTISGTFELTISPLFPFETVGRTSLDEAETQSQTRRSGTAEREELTVSHTVESMSVATLEGLKSAAIEELLQYASFRRGWDGYAGDPFRISDIARAIEIVKTVGAAFASSKVTPEVITPGPAGDGSIDVEVAFDGRTLIFTVPPNDPEALHVYFSDQDGKQTELDAKFDQGVLGAWIDRLLPASYRPTFLAAS